MSTEKAPHGFNRFETPDLADVASFEPDWTPVEEAKAKRK